jgi:hypothetical protein
MLFVIGQAQSVQADVWTSRAGSTEEGVMQRDNDFDRFPSFRDLA